MKKVSYRYITTKAFQFLVFFFSLTIFAQEDVAVAASDAASGEDPVKGKQLFNQNCAACHALNRKMTGPALANVETRLSEDQGLNREWLYAWIKNSAGVIKSGDSYANKIYAEYKQSQMTAFPTLSNGDIDNILSYTAAPPPPPPGGANAAVPVPVASNGISNEIILGALALVFGILVLMLVLVNKTLRRIAETNGVAVVKEEAEKRLPIWKAFAKNQFLMLCTAIFFLLASAYFAYGWMMQVGIDQGYAPVQPIHYSHKIHAGTNKIECKYCHSSARVSKHSGIPSLNVCMNCHRNIAEYTGTVGEGPSQEDLANGYTNEFYTKEIKKLYKAVGWDEENQQYTGDTQPVEWVRIHNLPDFAYFNHSQHVSVAGIECQTCHGPVEEMEIMEQYAPLTMGWCINCHRETNVQVAGNPYYEKIHDELSKKYGVEELTAAMMGGLECGKCHY